MTKAGFMDANGRHVQEGDEVQYRLGARHGILEYCGHDGAAWVNFFDTGRSEDVNWIHLCGVPPEFSQRPAKVYDGTPGEMG